MLLNEFYTLCRTTGQPIVEARLTPTFWQVKARADSIAKSRERSAAKIKPLDNAEVLSTPRPKATPVPKVKSGFFLKGTDTPKPPRIRAEPLKKDIPTKPINNELNSELNDKVRKQEISARGDNAFEYAVARVLSPDKREATSIVYANRNQRDSRINDMSYAKNSVQDISPTVRRDVESQFRSDYYGQPIQPELEPDNIYEPATRSYDSPLIKHL